MHGCQPVRGKHRFQTLRSIFLKQTFYLGGEKRLYPFPDAHISVFIQYLSKQRAGNWDSEVLQELRACRTSQSIWDPHGTISVLSPNSSSNTDVLLKKQTHTKSLPVCDVQW